MGDLATEWAWLTAPYWSTWIHTGTEPFSNLIEKGFSAYCADRKWKPEIKLDKASWKGNQPPSQMLEVSSTPTLNYSEFFAYFLINDFSHSYSEKKKLLIWVTDNSKQPERKKYVASQLVKTVTAPTCTTGGFRYSAHTPKGCTRAETSCTDTPQVRHQWAQINKSSTQQRKFKEEWCTNAGTAQLVERWQYILITEI